MTKDEALAIFPPNRSEWADMGVRFTIDYLYSLGCEVMSRNLEEDENALRERVYDRLRNICPTLPVSGN